MKNTLEIIIPAYNCSKTLSRTLDSLVLQNNKNFSVLIIDDCSTEDIKSIINTHQNKLSITYIRNDKNIGCGMSRQVGIDNTKADYISFLDSDDILLPNAVDDWLACIDKNDFDVVVSPVCSFFQQEKYFNIKYMGFFMMHGKVYKTSFLHKYNIKESDRVKCNDDLYFNWQVFDLTNNIYFLNNICHIYIERPDSISKSMSFLLKSGSEMNMIINLAKARLCRFKSNPLEQYKEIQKQYEEFLYTERKNLRNQIKQLNIFV